MPWWDSAAALIEALAGDPARESSHPVAILGAPDNAALQAMIHVLVARAAAFAGEPGSVARHLASAWTNGGNRLPRYLLLAGLGVDALASAWAGELSAAQRLTERATRLAAQAGLNRHPMLATAVLAEA